jgi:hypothetical protein
MYCPRCRLVYRYPKQEGPLTDPALCQQDECKKAAIALSAMPWISICSNGHMDDLPWDFLTHRDQASPVQKTCKVSDRLFYRQAGKDGSRPEIWCEACGARMSLSGLEDRHFLAGVRCHGKQPWYRLGEPCDVLPVAAGLGDLFIHYSDIESALDIPPDSRLNPRDNLGRKLRGHADWRQLQAMYGKHGKSSPVVQAKAGIVARGSGCDINAVWDHLVAPKIQPGVDHEDHAPQEAAQVLRTDEYQAFLKQVTDYKEYEQFITHNRSEPWRAWLNSEAASVMARKQGELISELIAAPRLREVRAFKGFSRVEPPHSVTARVIPADLKGESPWLPVGEFFGEGVFFVVDQKRLSRWSTSSAVQKQTEGVRGRFKASPWTRILGDEDAHLPAFIVLHTLAHLMIGRMSFECGYPSASLRERLYFGVDTPAMTGILIYLAASEPGGSLGGIARLAEPDRFAKLLLSGLNSARWCALDPVCGEHEGRGDHGLNRAACHACCLLPETSCEVGNLLLDRNLVLSFFDEA